MRERMKNKVYGIGINDADYCVIKTINGRVTFSCPYYRKWTAMLKRVKSRVSLKSRPTYEDVKVCEEWLMFSNFKAWMEQQDWEGKHLDKDLLGDGKLYSPDTCCFLTHGLNNFLCDAKANRGDYPVGVSYHGLKGLFRAYCNDPETTKTKHLGYYNTPEEAHLAWKTFKHLCAEKLAAKEPNTRISNALLLKFKNV